MIKNYEILKDSGKEREYIQQIPSNSYTKNQDILAADLGRALLLGARRQENTFNIVKWRTPALGQAKETSSLTANPHVLLFEDEIVSGDRAKNTSSGWYFEASVPGSYRISWNGKFVLHLLNEYTEKIIFDNYLPIIEPCTIGIYVNGTATTPLLELLWSAYNPDNTDYYVMTNRSDFWRTVGSQDSILNLNAGDKVDIRANFLQYAPLAVLTLTYFADININLLKREN